MQFATASGQTTDNQQASTTHHAIQLPLQVSPIIYRGIAVVIVAVGKKTTSEEERDRRRRSCE